jgi:hypothetical protein
MDITQIIRPIESVRPSPASRCAARKEPAIRAGHRALHYVTTHRDSPQICFSSQRRCKNLHFPVPDPLPDGLHYEDLFTLMNAQNSTGSKCPTKFVRVRVPKWPLAVT